MTSWELAANAIQTGIKIRHKQWRRNESIYYCSEKHAWLNSGDRSQFDPSFGDLDGWQEYKEPDDKYLYEYAYIELKGDPIIIPRVLKTKKEIESEINYRYKLLRKFDPDTLEEIIEDQNAQD